MTYIRVIPRDLFNEANLLKCYGQLYLNLEKMGVEGWLKHVDGRDYFNVWQDPADGSLTLLNVTLWVRGEDVRLRRPLNSRAAYPLWAYPDDSEEIKVFNDDGSFTDEMIAFLLKEGTQDE